jgi:ribose 5-phosphate isomerase B
MRKVFITEEAVRRFASTNSKSMEVPRGAIITALAADYASAHGISIVGTGASSTGSTYSPKSSNLAADHLQATEQKAVAFGSDHGGYKFKSTLIEFVRSLGYSVIDVGTSSEQPCDYPDFAYAVARNVVEGTAWRGVMIDGAGIGSSIAANKVPGVRAACCHNEFVARNAREHNDTNVLTLGSSVIGVELAKAILKVWLEATFAGGRHQGRVDKVRDLERRFLK